MTGRVWKFGDDVNTDLLAPGIYMKLPLHELASHCLETLAPEFSTQVLPGDFVVGGHNFGMGSSREQAAQVLTALGVAAVIAPSFGGIFYRNAFNLGLPAVITEAVDELGSGQKIEIDLRTGRIQNLSTGRDLTAEAVPQNLLEIVEAGGLVPYIDEKLNMEA